MPDIFSDYLGQVPSDKITKELREIVKSDSQIDIILNLFWRADSGNSLISYRSYLDLLKSFLRSYPNKIFTRSHFLKFAVDRYIKNDTTRSKLQEIAASMELLEKNSLSESDFNKLLSELNTSREQIKFDELRENNFFKIDRDFSIDDETPQVQFYHHTIQEYLAAEYILSFKNPLKKLKEFVQVQRQKKTYIKFSWYNVLRFFIEEEAGDFMPVTEWLIYEAEKNEEIIDEYFAIAITSINPNKIPENIRKKIFDLVYYTYRKKLLWLPIWSRDPLSRIITASQLQSLKADAQEITGEKIDDQHRFTRLGYVATIIQGMLENQSKLLENDKEYWRKKLIEFATDKNENGVLQRNALYGLISFHKPEDPEFNDSLIKQVKNAYDSTNDDLIKHAFIEFVSKVAPNSAVTIDLVMESLNDNATAVYARHALYRINSYAGVKYFLEKLVNNTSVLSHFLDKESIFNKQGKESDRVLINVIDTHADKLPQEMKAVIRQAIKLENYSDGGDSYFLKELASIIKKHDKNYFKELINIVTEDKTKIKLWKLHQHFAGLFARLIEVSDVDFLYQRLKTIDPDGSINLFSGIIQACTGREIYKYALDKKYIDASTLPEPRDFQKERQENILQWFREKLRPYPEKDQYMTDVFEFYINNEDILSQTNPDIERLKKILINSGLKINPREMKTTIPDKSGGSFTLSSTAQMYGDILRVAKKLTPESLINLRQNIIDFIPFAYTSDQQTIHELVPHITDVDLEFVNSVYANKKNDARYLIPSSYIHTIKLQAEKSNKLKSAIPILKDLIHDKDIKTHDKISAIEVLGLIISPTDTDEKSFFQALFDNYIDAKDPEDHNEIAEAANSVLITSFNDRKAVSWRIDQIIRRAGTVHPHTKSFEVRTPSTIEIETMGFTFAKPLNKLNDPSFLTKAMMLKLVDFGFELLSRPEKKQYEAYAIYQWRIASAYIKNIIKNEPDHIETIKKYLSKKYQNSPNNNWWNREIEELNRFILSERRIASLQNVTKIVSKRRKNGNK